MEAIEAAAKTVTLRLGELAIELKDKKRIYLIAAIALAILIFFNTLSRTGRDPAKFRPSACTNLTGAPISGLPPKRPKSRKIARTRAGLVLASAAMEAISGLPLA
ncbi:MAG: hypothetical protein WBW73_02790, partial [Rhodoplanes sp.]